MKKRIAVLLLLFLMTMALTSCMKMEVDLTIKTNGKINAKILYAVSDQVMAMADTDEFGYSSEDVAELKENGWKVEEYKEDGYVGYIMTQTNVSTKAIREALANSESDSTASDILTKKGSTYILDLPLGGMMPESSEDDMFDTMGMLRSFGASLKFRITFPSKPISHNATKVSEDGKTLEWDLLEMSSGETIHAEFKVGGGFLKYALIMSAATVAVLGIILLAAKKKKGSSVPESVPAFEPIQMSAEIPTQEPVTYDQTNNPSTQQ